jgi:hypothetical protein
MHRTKVAEFFLSRLTTADHAGAIVGDLLEISPGPLNFWSAVARIAAAFLKRPALAIVVTTVSGHLIRSGLAQWNAMTKVSAVGAFCLVCAVLMSMITVYSGIRRGLLDPVTKTAGALGLIASVALSVWQSMWGTGFCGVVALAFVVALLRARSYRKSLLWILAAGVCAIGGSYVAWWLLYPVIVQYSGWRIRLFNFAMDVPGTLAIAGCLAWTKPADAKEQPTYT